MRGLRNVYNRSPTNRVATATITINMAAFNLPRHVIKFKVAIYVIDMPIPINFMTRGFTINMAHMHAAMHHL